MTWGVYCKKRRAWFYKDSRVLLIYAASKADAFKFKSWREAARYAEWVNRHDAGRSDAEELELDE